MVKRNSKKGNNGVRIRPEKRLAIYLRDKFRCAYCFEDLHDSKPFDITLDHIIPFDHDGSNDETNLVTACRSCNCSRKDTPINEFTAPANVAKILKRVRKPLNKSLAKSIIAERN